MELTIRDYLKEHILLCDGAFGTYYSQQYQTKELPELSNTVSPERVLTIHGEYVNAGAKLLRTNTFGANTYDLCCSWDKVKDNITNACRLALIAAKDNAYVAGDIGPVLNANISEKENIAKQYIEICKVFNECKVHAVVFETFSDMEDILPAIKYLKENTDLFVIVQFAVSQYGYSSAGLSMHRLFELAEQSGADAYGLNCGVGPGHMQQLFTDSRITSRKYITSLPNAGYPQVIGNRMVYASNNSTYFKEKQLSIIDIRADIVGGCCGTTPAYIKELAKHLENMKRSKRELPDQPSDKKESITDNAFYKNKAASKNKLIAVELAPPMGSDDKKLMEAAHLLENSGVDVLTFPDSPSGRTRADAILMAEKVSKETKLCVMPHLCCRDKNAIAMRSQLLGAHINGINNFLVITGDPVPSLVRQTIKSVFNFDSVGLMSIIKDMNTEQFAEAPLVYGGAINQNRKNLEVEINRIKKKMENGATFFFTQPVFDEVGVNLIRRIKQETDARLLCGIMPLVSRKNAVFMKNEMTGIAVSEDIINRYPESADKEAGEAVGIQIAKEIMSKTEDFVDGYYFSFPFNRVYMLKKILE